MNTDLPAPSLGNVRGTDSNTLLRLYDQANEVVRRSERQGERARAGRVVERIIKELRKRNVLP
jgi:hypothetical protein